jgi:hypothetical protein
MKILDTCRWFNETRPGAKDKWKKIIELDLDDGEYYRKAFIKLRRYGVF